jgi:coenzyme F420-0:L-glutamate ligase / coenzyme F420-1:gamma-L-glutamate ligase
MTVEDAVVQTIRERRSVRQFQDRPVPHEIIADILQAAVWAPSAHNRQPWRFSVVTDNTKKHDLAYQMGQRLRYDLEADNTPEELIRKDTERSYRRMTTAPVLIVMCLSMMDMDTYPDPARSHYEYLMAVQSTAMAGQTLMLAAHALGLGTCWMCAPLFCPDVVRETLALADDWEPQGIIALGYAALNRSKDRKPLDTMVNWG